MLAHVTTAPESAGSDDYTGRLVATARYGDSEQQVTFKLAGEDEIFRLPGDGHARTVHVRPSGNRNPPFTCTRSGTESACTAAGIRAQLAG